MFFAETPASSGITWFAVPFLPATPPTGTAPLRSVLWAPYLSVWPSGLLEREGCLPSLPGSASASSRRRPAWCASGCTQIMSEMPPLPPPWPAFCSVGKDSSHVTSEFAKALLSWKLISLSQTLMMTLPSSQSIGFVTLASDEHLKSSAQSEQRCHFGVWHFAMRTFSHSGQKESASCLVLWTASWEWLKALLRSAAKPGPASVYTSWEHLCVRAVFEQITQPPALVTSYELWLESLYTV